MLKKILSSLLAAAALTVGLTAVSNAYPERPTAARMQYELYYLPVRLVSMVTAVGWDVPTGSFQDAIKGSIGATKMVSRNIGKEDGEYELATGAVVGGPIGMAGGATYGVFHGLGYGAKHGFVGYTSPHTGSYDLLFQGKQYVVPYDDNY